MAKKFLFSVKALAEVTESRGRCFWQSWNTGAVRFKIVQGRLKKLTRGGSRKFRKGRPRHLLAIDTISFFLTLRISIGNSMISDDNGINIASGISKLLYVISRAVRRVNFETILKFQGWYLCQISRTNHCYYLFIQQRTKGL